MQQKRHAPKRATNTTRRRQLLLTMVVALPPDTECTLDEAIELCHAIVDRVIADLALVAYVAIHDPAVKPGSSRSRNRHAHIHVALRTWTFEGALSRYKVRDLVARVRRHSGSNGKFDDVAEGISWPDLSRELQTSALYQVRSRRPSGSYRTDTATPFRKTNLAPRRGIGQATSC